MANGFRSMIERFNLKPRKLFLIDSLGAFLTASLIGTIGAGFQDVFGMPQKALYLLFIIAFIYAVYSICCYFSIGRNWRPFLKGIAIANLIYCCLTFGLVVFYYPGLTVLCLIYFLGELIVIGSIIYIELMTVSHCSEKKFSG